MLEDQLKGLAELGPLALAVSGGRDSTALMLGASGVLPSDELHVLTVDHQLRAEAADEARFVESWAGKLGVQHTTLIWTGEKPETGLQAAGRRARYRLMTAWCRDNGFQALVTAHTLDDQAETVLMRLKRGGGVDALSAMAQESWRDGVRLLRPLLGVSRQELTQFLEREGHPWIDDPSNENEHYERIRLRKSWSLAEELGLDRRQLAETAKKMTRARMALDHATNDLLRSSAEVSDLGFCSLKPVGFANAPEEIGIRALARCLQAIGGAVEPPEDRALERTLHWLTTPGSSATTLGGCRLARRTSEVVIARETGRIRERSVALNDGDPVLWDRRFQISASGKTGSIAAGPLGREGWAALKAVRPPLPAFVGRSLPALRRGEKVLAVPPIGYLAPDVSPEAQFSADFVNRSMLEPPAISHLVTGSS